MGSMDIGKLKRILWEKRLPVGVEVSLEARRQGMEKVAFRAADDLQTETVSVADRAAEWVRAPGSAADRAILYLHGGGYVMGSINTHRSLAGEISRAAGAPALVLDYRLAPEHPFPAAVSDGVAGVRWLLEHDFDPKSLTVAGDSAGGGLVVATLLSARDQGVPMPASAVCISPWTDLTCSNASYESRAAADPLVDQQDIRRMAELYLNGADPRHAYASPSLADLHSLPPLLIHVGRDEVLLDDAIQLSERARAAGTESTLEIWDDMVHVWHAFHPLLDEGKQGIARVGEFVREKW